MRSFLLLAGCVGLLVGGLWAMERWQQGADVVEAADTAEAADAFLCQQREGA